MNSNNLPEPPTDLDPISGDFINDSTAPQLFEEEEYDGDDYDSTEEWEEAFMSSAEFRAMVM